MMLLASPTTKFLTHVGHFGDHSRNQRRFAPTLPHFTGIGAPLQRNGTLLIEWPKEASEPTKYWLSNLPATTSLKSLVKLAKHRWIIERDYEELKQELGLGHYEGRGWRGFHHHATLCIAAYGFLMAERNRFSPSARAGHVGLSAPELPPDFRPRGSPRPPRTT